MTQGENVNPYPRKQKRREGKFPIKEKAKKKKGGRKFPVKEWESSIEPNGSNLPQGGSNDDDDVTYWLDLPLDETKRVSIKKGDLASSQAYVHVKPMLGGTFTDIVMWIFYPFNGGARAKVACTNIPLRTKGEHVGDWEHLTLRISNFKEKMSQEQTHHHRKLWIRE